LNNPTYTIETLKKLNLEKENTFFILGADAASGITSWNSYKELVKYTNFLIAPRESVSNTELKDTFPFEFQSINGSYLDISSTNVRKIINTENNLEEFIPFEIIEFIKENSLYAL
jgi:nicotinate-nucleotide adenylyltransferase